MSPLAHRATCVAPDLLERRIDRTRAKRAANDRRVSLKPTVGVTDPGDVRSRTVMRRGEMNLSQRVGSRQRADRL
jgi:hypothetical protein